MILIDQWRLVLIFQNRIQDRSEHCGSESAHDANRNSNRSNRRQDGMDCGDSLIEFQIQKQ